jgi:predicted nucleic acid-binding protein
MLFDTDVIIWLLRGDETAIRLVDRETNPMLSVVSYMELLRGARNQAEARELRSVLTTAGFIVMPLSENIGGRAAVYIEEYTTRGGLEVPDALIAATATEHNLALCTCNRKHYRIIADLEMVPFIQASKSR